MKPTLTLLVTAFFTFGISVSLFSQKDIQGKIIHAQTGESLPGANIFNSGKGTGTISDSLGSFVLENISALPDTIDISYVGFRDQRVIIESYNPIEVEMEPHPVLGETVIVSASRRKERSSEAPASISVLEQRNIASKALNHPVLGLQHTPGIDLVVQGTDNFQVNIRGRNESFTTETYFMLDYRSLMSPALGISILSRTPLDVLDLERVEVVRGPGSALYGPGVESGVVHFISKSALDSPGTSFSITGGTRETIGASFRHARKISDNLAYKITGYYQRSNDFDLDPENADDAESLAEIQQEVRSAKTGEILYTGVNGLDTENYKYGLTGTLEYRFDDSARLTATGGYTYRKGLVRAALGEALQDHPDYYGQVRYSSDNWFVQGFVNILDNTNEKGFLYRTGLTSINKYSTYQFQAQHLLDKIHDKLELVIGTEAQLSYSRTEGTVHGRYEDMDNFNIYSIYSQGEYALSEKLDFVVAGRIDRFQAIDNTSFSPRAGLVYRHKPTQSFRATYNRAVSSPQALFLFADIPFGTSPFFDIPLIGGIDPIDFDDPLTTTSFLPGVEPYTGTGLSLATAYAIATESLAPSLPVDLVNYLRSRTGLVDGTAQALTILNETPSSSLPERDVLMPSVINAFEIGYKGVFGDKLAASIDIYYNRRKDLVFVSQVSPLVIYPGLGAELSAAFRDATIAGELMALGADQDMLAELYSQVGSGLAQNPLGLIEPGLANNPERPELFFSFYNAGEIDYFGTDIGLRYYWSDALSAFANYSWLSKNVWEDDEIGQSGTGQRYTLNTAKNRIRFGLDYLPQSGFGCTAALRYQDKTEYDGGTIYNGTLDAYAIADLGVSYVFNENLRLSVTAQNLLDTKYRAMPKMAMIGRLVLAQVLYTMD